LNITKFGKNKCSNLQKQGSKQPTKVWKRKNYRDKTNAQIWILHNMKEKKINKCSNLQKQGSKQPTRVWKRKNY
jgi:hypothetical protein